ncbi:MAG TPA: amidohydrolase family protein [Pirellulales bacterium]|nr:amidohydrolase family protein [Pirellulales bacterium]
MNDSHILKFFDCNCAVGPYRTRVYRFAQTAGELIEELDFANIDRALVYHTAMRFDHPAVGNERVLQATAGQSRLSPTWAILPSHTREQPPVESLIKDMRGNGIRALRMFANDHRYFLDEITWGDQLAVYMERRIPLFVRASLDKVAQLLRSFPNMVIVAGSQGANPLDRYGWPLIERYPNLMFETSGYLVDGGIEEFCQRYSASRLVFGSGYPDNSSGAAMLHLTHAEISDDQRRQIAGGNLARILAEADLE